MRVLLLVSLFWVIGSRPVAAETFTFQTNPAHIKYKVTSNVTVATVRHPFRVVHFESQHMTGYATFNPEQINQGIQYALEIPLNVLDSPEGALRQALVGMLKRKPILISGQSIDLVKVAKTRADATLAVIRPQVQIGGNSAYPEVDLRIIRDGKVVRWEFKSEFTLTDFKIPVPRKWGIPAEDKVILAGELSFTPKE